MSVAIFSGMIGVTFFGLLLTPVFFTVLRSTRAQAPVLAPAQHPVAWLLPLRGARARATVFHADRLG